MAFVLLGPGIVAAGAAPIDDKRAEAATVASQLYEQANRIVELDAGFRRAQARLAGAEADVARAEVELATALRRLEGARKSLEQHAVGAYIHGGSVAFLSTVVRVGGDQPVVRRQYIKTMTNQDRRAIRELKDLREVLDIRNKRLKDARQRVQDQVDAIASDRNARNRAVAQQSALLGRINGELADLVAAEQARLDAEAAAAAAARAAAAAAAAAKDNATAPALVSSAPIVTGPVADTWACIRQLESGNNYGIGGGGAYQFLDSTWQALGYTGTASDYPPAVQDEAAVKLQALSGWSQWTTAPLCGRVYV